MQESTEFSYTYSAASNREAREIREKYMPRQESKLEELKRLDRRVQSSGMVQGLSVGIAGFLTMIPMLTPLDSGIMNVALCLAGGVLFSVGIGAVSNLILRKTSLV